MVIHLLKLSLGIVSLALWVTLISLDINLGGEATLRVSNLRVPPNSRVKVQTQLTPNSTLGRNAEIRLLPSVSYPRPKPYKWVCTHGQCSTKFQSWTFTACVPACHIRMLLSWTANKGNGMNMQFLSLQFKTTKSMRKRTEENQVKYLQNHVHTDRVNRASLFSVSPM